MSYKIADFLFEINGVKYTYLINMLNEYESEEKGEYVFDITAEDLDYERKIEPSVNNIAAYEYTAVLRKFGEFLPQKSGFILHSACFDVDGTGIVFSAHSGTGKTTHMNLWQQLLGDKMTVVNGDKPIVRFFDNEPETPYAYGTPWNGKERLGCNMRTPLKHICFIERSETNYVEKVQKQDVINRIFNQVYMPKDPVAVANTMTLIDRLLSCTDLWIIHCNMEPSAAEVAYNTIINGKISVGNDQCVVP